MSRWTPIADLPTLSTFEPKLAQSVVLTAVDNVLGVIHASCIPHWIADGPDRCCVCDAATELPAGSPREPQLVQLAVLATIDDRATAQLREKAVYGL